MVWGGRGITVCDEWKYDFMVFYNWAMANGYADNLTIDRIDVNGNYEPSNCRWITIEEQQRNRRNTIKINNIPLSIIAKNIGINYHTLYQRIYKLGWTYNDTISKKLRKNIYGNKII